MPEKKPNVVFVFGDQWRAQATGYAGDPNADTPHLDALAAESVNFRNAVATSPVCTPWRATFVTGRYPHTHGVFLNDVCLSNEAVSIAQAFAGGGYDTAYIGKWHIDGHGRSNYIPPERRQGFDFWKVLECTHNYNHSAYYAGDSEEKLTWEGYDAVAQTAEAIQYINDHPKDKPFLLVLSWGPPHAPYGTAPEEYRARYQPEELALHPNVPPEIEESAREDLAGYYAHIAVLDDCIGDLKACLKGCGIEDDTLFVFTSDHGDMLGSQGERKKQRPWDESVRVPLLLRYPAELGPFGRKVDMPIGTPDLMPTLLGLARVDIPGTVEGRDYSGLLRNEDHSEAEAALIACHAPFGQWQRTQGGREFRGVRTRRFTFVRDRNGPWLLYDNEADPYQLENLCGKPEHQALQRHLDDLLQAKLDEVADPFDDADTLIEKWGYEVDETGTVGYTN